MPLPAERFYQIHTNATSRHKNILELGCGEREVLKNLENKLPIIYDIIYLSSIDLLVDILD